MQHTPAFCLEQAYALENGIVRVVNNGCADSDSLLIVDAVTEKLLATLHVCDLSKGDISDFSCQQDSVRGLCSSEYVRGENRIRREWFASTPDRVVGMRIVTDSVNREQKLSLSLKLTATPHNSTITRMMVSVDGGEFCMADSIMITDAKEVRVYLLAEADTDAMELSGMRLAYKDFAKVRFYSISYNRNKHN